MKALASTVIVILALILAQGPAMGCASQPSQGQSMGPQVPKEPQERKSCVLPATLGTPERIAVEAPRDAELHEYWAVPDSPEWWAPAPDDAERVAYREALLQRLGGAANLEPRALLRRQRAVHAVIPGDGAREAENSDALLSGQVGTIAPASCLEWRLFQRQARRFPMLERPTEFAAYILRGQGELHIYLSGADRVGGRLSGEVRARVIADVARGFEPVAHLHNHPFMFDRQVGDRTWATPATLADIAGALAPSMSDVQLYRGMVEEFGLRGAWVTNGLDSAHFPWAAFDRLAGWP